MFPIVEVLLFPSRSSCYQQVCDVWNMSESRKNVTVCQKVGVVAYLIKIHLHRHVLYANVKVHYV